MGRILALTFSATLALLLPSPPAADAQEFAYVLEKPGSQQCERFPEFCPSRLLTIDLQELKVIRIETLSESTSRLARSVDGRTLLRLLEGQSGAYGEITAFDRVTLASRVLLSASPDATRRLFAASAADVFFRPHGDALDVFDLSGLRATVQLGTPADDLAVTPDGGTAYVATPTGLTIVDVSTATVADSITLPGNYGGGVAVSPDATAVFALRRDLPEHIGEATLYRIDVGSHAITASRTMSLVFLNSGLVVAADGLSLWLGTLGWYGPVQRLRADTLETIAQVPTTDPIYSLTLSPDGSKLLVTTGDSLAIIDAATSTLSATVELPALTQAFFGAFRTAVVLPANAPCMFRISPSDITVPVTGGSFSVTVPAQEGCAWTATATAPWVHQLSPQSGSGPGTVTFSVSYNGNAAARSTIVVVAGQDVALSQAAAVVAPGAPSAPVNVDAQLGAGGAVTLSWAPPPSGPIPTAYVIEAGTVTGDRNFLSANVGLQTSVSACCLPQATLFVRVRALNAAGTGPASTEIAINPFLPLTAPTNLRWVWTSPSEAVLSWSEPVRSAAGFRIQLFSRYPLTPLGTLDVTGHSIVVARTHVPRGLWAVTISGIDVSGQLGPPSYYLDIDMDDCVRRPDTPTLNVTANGRLVTIDITSNSRDAFDAFRLYAGRSPGASDVGVIDVTTPQFSVLAPPGQYYLRAALVNGCGVSQASTEQSITVP